MRFGIQVDADGAQRAIVALLGRVERGVWSALDNASALLETQARAVHAYQNRTTRLEGSTNAIPASGDVWSDDARGGVAATMPYARYVDGWAREKTGDGILDGAWSVVQSNAASQFEQILEEAVRG